MSTGKGRIIIQAGIVFMLCIVVVLFGRAYAQPGPPSGFDPKESFDQFMTDCTRELNLTEDQESKMLSILKEQFEEQKAYREKMKKSENRDFRAMKKEMDRIRENTDEQLKPVLTDEQMEKFRSLREERREKFREEMRKRRKIE